MIIDDQIEDEKPQYAKISAISSGKIDNYEYLTGEKLLPLNQKLIIWEAKRTYSLAYFS